MAATIDQRMFLALANRASGRGGQTAGTMRNNKNNNEHNNNNSSSRSSSRAHSLSLCPCLSLSWAGNSFGHFVWAYWKIVVVGKTHLAIVCHTWAAVGWPHGRLAGFNPCPSYLQQIQSPSDRPHGSPLPPIACLGHCSGFSINDLHRVGATAATCGMCGQEWARSGCRWICISRSRSLFLFSSLSLFSGGTPWGICLEFDFGFGLLLLLFVALLLVLLTSAAALGTRKSLLKIITMFSSAISLSPFPHLPTPTAAAPSPSTALEGIRS